MTDQWWQFVDFENPPVAGNFHLAMIEADLSPIHAMPSGLCEDPTGVAAALIGRMAKGDGGALAELYEMWSPTLLGVSCRMLGDRREAEEVVQDTFVRMWHRSAEYDPHLSPPFVWAFAVMRGYCIDRLRFRHRGKRDSSRVVPIHLHAPVEKTEDPRVMVNDDWRRVRAALDQLPPDERSCLELAVFLEYTHSEIADHLGTPLGTVKNRLRRALEKVRNQLSRYEL
ncbi:MAG: RNA polymerase sigma factor [Akkermansiaceae bacterium]|jgi:RNA polymerase sigma-70 factor (ECF subfamily)|nr:RNA polymerase sigma factor [Akkermansiaceae bacterium]